MKCITDIKIIIHPSVWHVCVPLHWLVFMAASFYMGLIFPTILPRWHTRPHTHTHTQLHYIARDNVLSPLIQHSCPRVQCTSGGIATIVIPGGTWSCIFCNERKIHVCKLMDPWGVRNWVLSQDWCTYAIMLRYSFFDCCCSDKAVPW